jgi:hypothetical protein
LKLDGFDRLARVDANGNAHLLDPDQGWPPKSGLPGLVSRDPDMWDEISEAGTAAFAQACGCSPF